MAQMQWTRPLPPPAHFKFLKTDPSLRIPPAIPDVFVSLGKEEHTKGPIVRSLTEQGIPQLYEEEIDGSVNFKVQLQKVNSIIISRMTLLVEKLVSQESNVQEFSQGVQFAFINMYHLLNLYRQHHARYEISQMLEKQLQERKDSITRLLSIIEDGSNKVSKYSEFMEDALTERVNFFKPPEAI
eukprot:TRINITY_DN161935_c0_g1_i1.p1 TRINITY_DN161935_c0_g1~~TRINITY_DN161935_c0_g1_i1.p1  ORF type:complete len:184 (+),score=38.92 TRINITY_DN161935_c0_g1_i1:41-592(+)